MLKFVDRRLVPPVALVAVLVMVTAMALVFFYAPIEQQMGIVQKLFYVHVPSAMAMYAGFVVAAVCSFLYLIRPAPLWDSAAVVGAETGLVACVFVLISGPLWAYKAWGTPWTWDPQLTATFVLFIMYGSYVLLRRFGGSGRGLKQVAAALAVVAVINVPIVHYAVELWGGMHPVVEREGGDGLEERMSLVLGVSMVGFLLTFFVLFWTRFRNRWLETKIDELHVEVVDLQRLQQSGEQHREREGMQ